MRYLILSNKIMLKMSNSNFLKNDKITMISNMDNNRLNGFQISQNKEHSMVAAIGEYIERQYLIEQNKLRTGCDIQAFSLLNKQKIRIKSEDMQKKNILLDSCGMATHKNSADCIRNALSEFIERQSFIFNYLSKGRGQRINMNLFPKIYTDKYFKDIKFYNISLIKEYYVVVGKGMVENKFHIGLGSSNSIVEAIKKCIKEIKQCQISIMLTSNKNSGIRAENRDYIDYFLAIESERLDTAYKYLDKNHMILENHEDNEEFNLDKIVNSLWNNCKIEPLMIVYNTKKSQMNVKAIHIFDLNWFPSLQPSGFCGDNYNYIEKVMDCKIDRKCNFIPIS